MIPQVWLWALLGGSSAVGAEFLMRRGWGWLDNWYIYIPLALVINICVYQMLVTGKSWLPSIVIFGLVTAVARIILAFLVLREPASTHTILAAVVLFIPTLWKIGSNLWSR